MLARHVFSLHTQKVEPNPDLPPDVMAKYGDRDLRGLKHERAIHIGDVMTDDEVIQLVGRTFAQPCPSQK